VELINLEQLIDDRILQLEDERTEHNEKMEIERLAGVNCNVRIQELQTLREEAKEQLATMRKANIQKEIKRNTLKDLLTDPKDATRFNVFIEFMDKCGDESVYKVAVRKMSKLGSVIYGKKRLWVSWPVFKEDFHMWLEREGRWAGILDKASPSDQEV
jgi:hypothetical protein